MSHDLPDYRTILLERRGRLLVMTLNRPEALNAVNLDLHDELPEALAFAGRDNRSDVVLLTGAGRAFSAGGDIAHMEHNAANPHLFDHEARQAKRIVSALLDIEKPVVCRMNGHAVGLGASIALLCDIIFVEIGLINHCLPADQLDGAVDAFCARLLAGAPNAIRWTKILTNMELKRIAGAVMEAGIAYESLSVRTADHREGIAALKEKRTAKFTGR